MGWWKRHGMAALPAAIVAVVMGGLWQWARFLYGNAAETDLESLRKGAFVGWLGLMLLAVTVAGVIWAAAARSTSVFEGRARQELLGFAILGDTAGLLVLLVGWLGGYLTIWAGVKVYLLLVAWTGLWMAVAAALKRWGAGVSIGVTLTIAMVLMAGPVVLAPAARAAGAADARGGDWVTQDKVVKGIGMGCPMLGVLDAVRPGLEVHWGQLPGMYAMSGLGQEIPMDLPRWWVSAGVYGVVGALVWGVRVWGEGKGVKGKG